jgi:hypothetical protein
MKPKRILRAVIGAGLIVALLYSAFFSGSDVPAEPAVLQWMILDVVLLVCAGAGLVALVNRTDEFMQRPAAWRQAGAWNFVRGWLVDGALATGALTVIGFIVLSVAVAITTGKPPIAWGRVGGAMSDWVIYVCLLLPLSLGGTFMALASLVIHRVRPPTSAPSRPS